MAHQNEECRVVFYFSFENTTTEMIGVSGDDMQLMAGCGSGTGGGAMFRNHVSMMANDFAASEPVDMDAISELLRSLSYQPDDQVSGPAQSQFFSVSPFFCKSCQRNTIFSSVPPSNSLVSVSDP